MSTEFRKAIKDHEAAFGISLSDTFITRVESYRSLLLEHNPILHLTAPIGDEEFAIRHILESLAVLKHLPLNTRFADVGSGGGLPAIPCLLARDDLYAVLIESKEKKAKFLDLVVENLGIKGRIRIIPRQFQEVDLADCSFVTCRALDKFTDRLGRLLKWSLGKNLLLFGGPNLREELARQKARFAEERMPLSEQRFLFIVEN